jgi:RNA polymerase sigma-70 factor (ECF subfamily)
MDTTSHTLLDEVRRGPGSLAWQRWHGLYQPLIQKWLARNGLVPTDRDDIAQDVLAVVVRRLPEFDHNGRTGAFRNWLKTITINCLREHWKSQARSARTAAESKLDAWADPASDMSADWDREHDTHLLTRLLALLEPEFAPATWQAFRKLVIDGEAASAVAQSLSITVNAVYIAKSRVLTRLRAEAAGLVDDPLSMPSKS